MNNQEDRRTFLTGMAAIGASVLGAGALFVARAQAEDAGGKDAKKDDEDVSPAEDLMREHGVLKRILLIYGEGTRRLDAKEDLPPEAIADSAKLIREFVEDYHEKLEQDFLFPRFRKANKLVDLVDVLFAQHQAGRKLTDTTLQLANANANAMKNADDRRKLSESLNLFIRMYNPHEAREDTILFPAFRALVSKNEYDSLGADFEKKENQLFGNEGFEMNVEKVTAIEKKLGIYELAQFTPKV